MYPCKYDLLRQLLVSIIHERETVSSELHRWHQGLMGMLLLAALHGETGLRGMWSWSCGQWEHIAGLLDLWGTKGVPA